MLTKTQLRINRVDHEVSPALAGRPFRRCLSGVVLLVSHSCDCDVVNVDHDYKFDMFAARNFFINRTNKENNSKNRNVFVDLN